MTSVLTFHAVTDVEWFDNVIKWLKRRYRLVPIASLSAFYAGAKGVDKSCHITVDDGERSFYEVVFPILKENGVPASLFVSPKVCVEGGNFWFQEIRGYGESVLKRIAADVLKVPPRLVHEFSPESILKSMPICQMNEVIDRYQHITGTPKRARQNMSVSELREVAASGLVSIGAHTMSHPILMNEENASCQYEISTSVKDLSTLLGWQVREFAYPNGIAGVDFSEREEQVLRRSGIRMAFTTEARHLSGADNTLRIPRLAVSDKETMLRVRAKMLLGSSWNGLKKIAGTGEYVERRRLSRALSCFRRMDANGLLGGPSVNAARTQR